MTDAPKRGWAKGQSGNPAGKKSGSRSRALLALDKIGFDNAAAILQAAVKAAIGNEKHPGDVRAMDLILSRVWPARRGRTIELDIPPVKTAADLPAALAAITEAVTSGILTTDEGQAVAAVLDAQRRGIETADLDRRLTALEEQRHDDQP